MSLCSAPLYNLAASTRPLLLEKMKSEPVPEEIQLRAVMSKKSERGMLQLQFGIANSALQYNREIGNHLPRTAVKWTTRTYVVEVTFQYWRSGASQAELLHHTNYVGRSRIDTNCPWRENKMNNTLTFHSGCTTLY